MVLASKTNQKLVAPALARVREAYHASLHGAPVCEDSVVPVPDEKVG
jgi:hypothetical protein